MRLLQVALLVAPIVFGAVPAIAQPRCDDHISYMVNSEGECIDLSSLTRLSKIRSEIDQINKQVAPLVVRNLKLIPNEDRNLTYIEAEVFNQSQRPVRFLYFTVRVTQKNDGETKTVLAEKIDDDPGVIGPGQSLPIRHKVPRTVGGEAKAEAIEYTN